jgi:beta-ribofuranosylaminobenzene 5'-phosphate synthase
MRCSVRVCAPCRLHFGMFSFGHDDRPQFGGVGVMIEPPHVNVRVVPADRFTASGDHCDRATSFARMAADAWQLKSLPNCRLEIQSPPDHTGLGVGTQLGLTVAAGLRKYLKLSDLSAEELATSVGRGQRSAVGTYGFALGGLIVDTGKQLGQRLSTLGKRLSIPERWRFVLVRPPNECGLAGEGELAAFSRLPPVPSDVTKELWRITNENMLPALTAENCELFGDAIFRFGRLAGECFATAQGGPFASSRIAGLVSAIRDSGVPGVGQSSWGPTVFAVAAEQAEAERLVAKLRNSEPGGDCEIMIASPNNHGAIVKPL